ncbi:MULTISPECIES: phosphoribosyltransferase domain-containing protein [unclassified Psychrobacter]|uniref:phosphoribosyltransferase domain-containing protein n=1 Tax=unclassified Psychrobacter TaxID=196806 RepID=UPI0018F28091|nr:MULTISPECIES: phosphoribosyltransferase domain-containing protein [unclassified Psychrobacter]
MSHHATDNIPTQHQVTLPRGTLQLSYRICEPVGTTSTPYQLSDLLGFAQRINPKRAFLFVSKVLGRHIPVAPSTMRRSFTDLADAIPDNLPEPIVVVGMAETAVGLSAGVHSALQTRYPNALLLNSTRHAQADATLLTTFSEDHSHASRHLLYQSNDSEVQKQLLASKTLIMIDDEASTGNTCINVVNALRVAGLEQLAQVHLTTLVDWSLGQATMDEVLADKLAGIAFHRHHLLSGAWQWQDAPNPPAITMPSVDTTDAGSQPLLPTGIWGRLPTYDSRAGFQAYLAAFQTRFAEYIGNTSFNSAKLPERVLVLGSNEFVWLPFLLAEWLSKQAPENDVKFSALTRSPIALGGAIECMLSFQDNYGLGMTNFVYNVDPKAWDLIVLCIETPLDSVDALWAGLDNVLVVSPAAQIADK